MLQQSLQHLKHGLCVNCEENYSMSSFTLQTRYRRENAISLCALANPCPLVTLKACPRGLGQWQSACDPTTPRSHDRVSSLYFEVDKQLGREYHV